MNAFLVLLASSTLFVGRAQDSRPASAPTVAPAAAAEHEARALEIDFEGAGALDLHGTLVLPAEIPDGGVPALVLLPGSGPTDRDGNQPPYLTTDLLKSVAASLAEAGIASLRFDKRSASPYHLRLMTMTIEEQDAFFAFDMFVGDALAALATLRGRAEVDRARCGILGHSEGGLFALELARRTAASGADAEPLAALVLAGTPGTNLAEVLRYQIPKIIAPYPESIREQLMTHLDRVMQHVVETRTVPDDVPPALAALFPYNCADLLAAELALDPAVVAAKVAGPVLILHGEHDVQVPPTTHVERLAAGFARRADDAVCEVVVVPGASHNLKPVSSPEEPGFAGDVAPEALTELRAWLAKHLAR